MNIPYAFNPLGIASKNEKMPLTLTFTEAGQIKISMRYTSDIPEDCQIEYNYNNSGWQKCDVRSSYSEYLSVSQGDNIQFRNMGNIASIDYYYHLYFDGDGKFDVSGNIMSLINYGDLYTSCFSYLFQETHVEDASNLILPATTLADSCYYGMFKNCTSLTKAPKILPATTLADSCYDSMFSGCSSLTEAPEIMATTDAGVYNVCRYMFEYCSSLMELKIHFEEITNVNNFLSWLFNTPSGTLYVPDNLSINGINDHWNVQYF